MIAASRLARRQDCHVRREAHMARRIALRDHRGLRAIPACRRIVRAAGSRHCRAALTSIANGAGEFSNSMPASRWGTAGQRHFVTGRPTSGGAENRLCRFCA